MLWSSGFVKKDSLLGLISTELMWSVDWLESDSIPVPTLFRCLSSSSLSETLSDWHDLRWLSARNAPQLSKTKTIKNTKKKETENRGSGYSAIVRFVSVEFTHLGFPPTPIKGHKFIEFPIDSTISTNPELSLQYWVWVHLIPVRSDTTLSTLI